MSYSLIISIVLGILIGMLIKLPKKLVSSLTVIQTSCLLFMLFFMGIKIGIDKSILQNLGVIGGKAIILAVASIIGSVLLVIPISKSINLAVQRKVDAE